MLSSTQVSVASTSLNQQSTCHSNSLFCLGFDSWFESMERAEDFPTMKPCEACRFCKILNSRACVPYVDGAMSGVVINTSQSDSAADGVHVGHAVVIPLYLAIIVIVTASLIRKMSRKDTEFGRYGHSTLNGEDSIPRPWPVDKTSPLAGTVDSSFGCTFLPICPSSANYMTIRVN